MEIVVDYGKKARALNFADLHGALEQEYILHPGLAGRFCRLMTSKQWPKDLPSHLADWVAHMGANAWIGDEGRVGLAVPFAAQEEILQSFFDLLSDRCTLAQRGQLLPELTHKQLH